MGVGKQGHACCGGCCDVRRAVIIVNIINVIFSFLGLGTMIRLEAFISSPENGDATVIQEAMSNFNVENLAMGTVLTLVVIRIGANGLGILGAATYNMWMVGISLTAY
jgi:hypothetical protein